MLKSFTTLENADAINKRVGEVKDFIKSIKEKQNAEKMFFSRKDRDVMLSTNKKKLSHSIVLDRGFSQSLRTIDHQDAATRRISYNLFNTSTPTDLHDFTNHRNRYSELNDNETIMRSKKNGKEPRSHRKIFQSVDLA